MARQYGRKYSFTIIPKDGVTKTITDLRISFEVTKSLISFPNIAIITLYNPNEDTYSKLKQTDTNIVLNAGYDGNIKLVFKGNIRNAFITKQGTDRIVTIYAGDGDNDWQNAVFNKTFSENISVDRAVAEMIATFEEATTGIIEGLPTSQDKLRGQVLSGPTKNLLDNYGEEYGFNWSIQDGEVTIIPSDMPISNADAVLISQSTGMLGSPAITEIGVDVTTLLNPSIIPNGLITVDSKFSDTALGNLEFRTVSRSSASGNYKVQQVIHRGDSRNGDWVSVTKGVSL